MQRTALLILRKIIIANTYTQSYFHLVFSPKNKEALIKREWRPELEKYITAIVQNNGHKLLAIGGMPDHMHILIGYNLNERIPDLVEEIKTSTNRWIKDNKVSAFKFQWQRGYGAFTHSKTQIEQVIKYILTQEEHHQKKSFREEYMDILNKNGVEYDDKYLFEFFSELI